MLFTEAGWVQSYGSRYVRPPIICGDVQFIKPITVTEFAIAQVRNQSMICAYTHVCTSSTCASSVCCSGALACRSELYASPTP